MQLSGKMNIWMRVKRIAYRKYLNECRLFGQVSLFNRLYTIISPFYVKNMTLCNAVRGRTSLSSFTLFLMSIVIYAFANVYRKTEGDGWKMGHFWLCCIRMLWQLHLSVERISEICILHRHFGIDGVQDPFYFEGKAICNCCTKKWWFLS